MESPNLPKRIAQRAARDYSRIESSRKSNYGDGYSYEDGCLIGMSIMWDLLEREGLIPYECHNMFNDELKELKLQRKIDSTLVELKTVEEDNDRAPKQ